jgi:subtilisin family serine protease
VQWTKQKWAAVLAAPMFLAALTAVGTAPAGAAPRKAALTATDLSATSQGTISVAKSESGRLARTDPTLLGQHGAAPVNVVIKYDFDATASYRGDVAGFAATSPAVTGKSLAKNKDAVGAYERYATTRSSAITAGVLGAVPGAKMMSTFTTAYGGVAARVPADSIAALLKVPGVAAVQRDTLEHPLDDNTQFVGATTVWSGLGGAANAGSNIVFGDIDTGVWPEHPMLSPTGVDPPAGGLKDCSAFATDADVAHLGPAFTCNNKLIGAYAKLTTYMSAITTTGFEFCNDTTKVCSPRDSEGHGTHTTTTAAGDCVTTAVLFGVDRGPVCGIAPGAHVIEYRVCLAQGCFNSDSISAIQQAIADGVNVINYSISGGASPFTDPVELAFLDATHAGISVNAAAGNSGPGASTSDHGGPWVTTVGASTGPRSFTTTLHLAAVGPDTLDVPGVTLTNGVTSPAPIVLAQTIAGEDALCQSKLAAGTATGKVVLCARGINARVDKGFNVIQGGAAGMVLYNTVNQDVETDNHWLPAVQVNGPADTMLNFIASHTGVTASWAQGQPTPSTPDVMAAFSSRGPQGDWIKPDVTAPGVQVLAGTTPQPDGTTNGPPGNLYMAIAGTSMATPHAAGVSVLVKAAHPDWTPEEIKSALMTSSVQTVVKEDGTTPADPFDMGAGSIRADRAVNPTLVFNETYEHFVSAGTDPLHRVDLNIPSIDATTMPGTISTTRTAINVSGANQALAVHIAEPAGVTITVGKKNHNLKVKKEATITFPIVISALTVPNGQYTARITLVPKSGTPVTIPVAFVKQQGVVNLTHSCSPETLPVKTTARCTVVMSNSALSATGAILDVAQQAKTGSSLKYANVSAPATAVKNKGLHWDGALSAAVPPQVTAINNITGNGPVGGYVPLSQFGISPITGVGDDTITNFTVPAFSYGGEQYNRIGIVSNGYVVIGGGDAGDVNFFPQTFPNTARPNNVLAPLWTDLNPSAGGTISVAELSNGVQNWLVVDWNKVKNFSDATTHSFEVWLESGDAGNEQITFDYGTGANAGNASSGDPNSAVNWGAENRLGTSGLNIAAPPADGSEYRPVLSGPTPGGSVVITYDVTSSSAKTLSSVAAMTSSLTPGITQSVAALTFTP